MAICAGLSLRQRHGNILELPDSLRLLAHLEQSRLYSLPTFINMGLDGNEWTGGKHETSNRYRDLVGRADTGNVQDSVTTAR